MNDLTKAKIVSKRIADEIRRFRSIRLMADLIYPNYNNVPMSSVDQIFYVDVLGDYGPTQRLFFFVREEEEILSRIAITKVMEE